MTGSRHIRQSHTNAKPFARAQRALRSLAAKVEVPTFAPALAYAA